MTGRRPPRLILASGSPYRRALLARLGADFDVRVPNLDEEDWKRRDLEPDEVVASLAQAKAARVLADAPDALVVGSDQTVALDGAIYGKPRTAERARAQLARFAGRTHRLLTAVCVLSSTEEVAWVDETRMTMRALTPDEIARYVEADQPFDCAGSYKLESRGIALFASIETEDASAIEGLPLIRLTTELRRRGYEIP